MNPLIDLLIKVGGVFAAIAAVLAFAIGLGGDGSSMPSSNPNTTNTVKEVDAEDIAAPLLDDPGESQVTPETEGLYGPVAPHPNTVTETEILDAVNVARAERGLKPLSMNASYSKKAVDLAIAQTEDGNSFSEALPVEGTISAASSFLHESKATDASLIINDFMKTEDQAVKHIFNPNVTQVGIGRWADTEGKLYVHAYFL